MKLSQRVTENVRRVGLSAVRTVAKTFAIDRGIEAWLADVDAAWTLGSIRARVVEVIAETHDTKTFVLEPNGHWPGHVAGQFVPVEVDVEGVRNTRCYSLSSAPSRFTTAHAPRVAITVKRVAEGRVSTFLHEHLRYGQVVRLGLPSGDFVLPSPRPTKLLLVSGGSGVTPVMAILRSLVASGHVGDVVFVHAARSANDVIFRDELARLAGEHPQLRVITHLDDRSATRLDATKLADLVPDWAERHTMLCGPAGMMESLAPHWARAGLSRRLQMERFVAPPRPGAAPGTTPRVMLTMLPTGKVAVSEGGATLLEALEAAGETPAFGCRMGICNTCVCRKKSGVVEDSVTGALSSEPDEDIRLCTTRARSDIELVF